MKDDLVKEAVSKVMEQINTETSGATMKRDIVQEVKEIIEILKEEEDKIRRAPNLVLYSARESRGESVQETEKED